MMLRKPPIVEVWAGFTFEPSSEKSPWVLESVMPFVQQFKDRFPHVQLLRTEEFKIEERTPTGVPKKISGKATLDRIQARNKSGTRWIQVGEDLLVYNMLESASAYPGYKALRDESLQACLAYMQHFRPAHVREVALHYVDIVEIPSTISKEIELNDYFRVYAQFPKEFQSLSTFNLSLGFATANEDDSLNLRFRDEPPNPATEAYRFRMEWHCASGNVNTLDSMLVGGRLDRARVEINRRFQASFEAAGWALFEPTGEH